MRTNNKLVFTDKEKPEDTEFTLKSFIDFLGEAIEQKEMYEDLRKDADEKLKVTNEALQSHVDRIKKILDKKVKECTLVERGIINMIKEFTEYMVNEDIEYLKPQIIDVNESPNEMEDLMEKLVDEIADTLEVDDIPDLKK